MRPIVKVPFMTMATREPPSARLRTCASMCSGNQELAVADAGQARPEAAGPAPVVLAAHRVLVALPVLAVGRVGDHVVDAGAGVPVVRERAPEDDVLGVAAVLGLHEEVRLADGEGLGGFTSWPNRWMSAPGFTAGAQRSPSRVSPDVRCSFAMVSMPPEPQHGS